LILFPFSVEYVQLIVASLKQQRHLISGKKKEKKKKKRNISTNMETDAVSNYYEEKPND